MGAPKPCLGYPSRTEAVRALRAQGRSTNQIAGVIGISVSTVSALELGSGRVRAMRTPSPTERVGRVVMIPADVLDKLGPHAARRNIHPNHLVRLIVSTVVDENLIDSVMDDADNLDWS